MNDLKPYENSFKKVYGTDKKVLEFQHKRYSDLIEKHLEYYGPKDVHLFSTPGRTEIGGNHTDHNHGRVLAGSINLDSIAVVSKNEIYFTGSNNGLSDVFKYSPRTRQYVKITDDFYDDLFDLC